MLACALFFVASLPNALREARGARHRRPGRAAAVSAHLFGYVALAPLLAYGLAAARAPRRRAPSAATGGFSAARAALFWSVLLAAPLALALALVGVAAEARARRCCLGCRWLGYAGLAFWLWLFAASLAEAEGFAATGRSPRSWPRPSPGSRAARARRIARRCAMNGTGRTGGSGTAMWGQLVIDSLMRPRTAARQVLAVPMPGAHAAAGGGAGRLRWHLLGYLALRLEPGRGRRGLGGGDRQPARSARWRSSRSWRSSSS